MVKKILAKNDYLDENYSFGITYVNMTLSEYINRIRIKEACAMI